jgi:hypothetical protein
MPVTDLTDSKYGVESRQPEAVLRTVWSRRPRSIQFFLPHGPW